MQADVAAVPRIQSQRKGFEDRSKIMAASHLRRECSGK